MGFVCLLVVAKLAGEPSFRSSPSTAPPDPSAPESRALQSLHRGDGRPCGVPPSNKALHPRRGSPGRHHVFALSELVKVTGSLVCFLEEEGAEEVMARALLGRAGLCCFL